MRNNIAIIFAGGQGKRMGLEIPKQFLKVNGKPILAYTLEIFENSDDIDKIYISTLEDYIPYVHRIVCEYGFDKVRGVVRGGQTAQDSIYNALLGARNDGNADDSIVLLHDGVRPVINQKVIEENINTTITCGNAITCTEAYETLIISDDGKTVSEVPLRKNSYTAQAPQTFFLGDIISAHDIIRKKPNGYENMVDACTIYKAIGRPVYLVKGNRGNIKITTPEDVYAFRAYLEYKENEQTFGLGLTEDEDIKNITRKRL